MYKRQQLHEGYTLPADWYSDPVIFALEQRLIFARSWQYAGPVEWLAQSGSYFTAHAGHVPVVIVRDDDTIRAFVNVCRHRAHLVAQGRGTRQSLQCPYHAWTYGLDGCLRSAPRAQHEATFRFEDLSLIPIACETAGPFVFVNPDADAAPLTDTLGDVLDQVTQGGIDFSALRLRSTQEWAAAGNWKNAIENNLECYHCPVAHPSFSRAIDVSPEAYRLRVEGQVMSQTGPVRHGSGELPEGEIVEAQYHMVFPNTSIDVVPGPPNVEVYSWVPDGLAGMRGTVHYFYPESVTDTEIAQLQRFNAEVGGEDVALIASVQVGLDSGMVRQGRLMAESEQLISRFQRLVFEHLRPEIDDAGRPLR